MAQMEYGNTHTYNAFNDDFDLDGLEDALYDLCEKGNVPMNERTFVVTTGNRGMIQVHKAIMKLTSGWSAPSDNNASVINKVNNPVHQNSFAFGGQFVELRSPNGLVMKFVYEPAYDDPIRNKIAGPDGRGVLNSYRYDIWDLGSSNEPNMYMCKVRGYENSAAYIIGRHNPFGIKSQFISHDEDSAAIDVMDKVGACVLDPSRCLSYIPSGLIG